MRCVELHRITQLSHLFNSYRQFYIVHLYESYTSYEIVLNGAKMVKTDIAAYYMWLMFKPFALQL